MVTLRLLLTICGLATIARADCFSRLTKDCGAAAGAACAQCTQSHQKDLMDSNCTLAEMNTFCADSTCAKSFISLCRSNVRKVKQSCLNCTQSHEEELDSANCTESVVEILCGGGPSPGPSPSPSPPTSACAKALEKDCPAPADKQACLNCARAHQADLELSLIHI